MKDAAILCMRLVSDGLSLDMMIFSEKVAVSRATPLYEFALPTVKTSQAAASSSIFTLHMKHRGLLTRTDTAVEDTEAEKWGGNGGGTF